MMPNNPMAMLMNAVRGGGNPTALIEQMAVSNPQVKQAMDMMKGKNPQQLRAMAENMAAERGVSINDVARQLGIVVPSNR